jgi:hypothetical protein
MRLPEKKEAHSTVRFLFFRGGVVPGVLLFNLIDETFPVLA